MSDLENGVNELSEENTKLISQLIGMTSENFNDLIECLKLDPRQDLVCTNLSFVDFSDSDLRGYNFSQANLIGCFGVNIEIDKTTKFVGSKLANSVFYSFAHRMKIIRRYELVSEIERLRGAKWDYQIYYFDRKTVRGAEALKLNAIAQSLFITTDDSAVRSMLLSRIETLSGAKRTIDFIKSVLATEKNSDLIATTLSYYLRKIESMDEKRSTLILFTRNRDEKISRFAIVTLIEYASKWTEVIDLGTLVQNCRDAWVRTLYLRRLASLMGTEYLDAVTNFNTGHVIDFAEPITAKLVRTLAEAQKDKKVFLKIGADISDYEADIWSKLNKLKSSGVAFKMLL